MHFIKNIFMNISKVLRKFENDFNTRWEGEFYIDDGEKNTSVMLQILIWKLIIKFQFSHY